MELEVIIEKRRGEVGEDPLKTVTLNHTLIRSVRYANDLKNGGILNFLIVHKGFC